MGRLPKPPGERHNRNKRPELGIVPVDTPAPLAPKPPTGLLASTRRVWKSYWSSPVAKVVDIAADLPRIERWIRTLDEYERSYAMLKKVRLVHGASGQPVLNPLAGYCVSLATELGRAETDLGLTPLARLKLGIAYGQASLTLSEMNAALAESEPAEISDDESDDWKQQWRPA